MKFLVMEASLHAGENLNVKPIITTPRSTFFQSHVLATKVRLQNGSWILNTGHFPFDQDFLVNFRQFPVVSGTAFSKNSKKGTSLHGISKFSKVSSPSFLSFAPVNVHINFQKFNRSHTFWKFSQEISVSFTTVYPFHEISLST